MELVVEGILEYLPSEVYILVPVDYTKGAVNSIKYVTNSREKMNQKCARIIQANLDQYHNYLVGLKINNYHSGERISIILYHKHDKQTIQSDLSYHNLIFLDNKNYETIYHLIQDYNISWLSIILYRASYLGHIVCKAYNIKHFKCDTDY